jgi:hypothetical protein
MKGYARLWVVLIILITAAVFILHPFTFTGFFVYTSGQNASLGTWDITDPLAGEYYVYAEGSSMGSGPGATTLAFFYANYTNVTTGEAINGSDTGCNITFNVSGSWTSPAQMWFNSSSKLYVYNRTFTSRGNYYWNTTCYGSAQGYDNLSAVNNISVTNTPAGIYVPLPSTNCTEDTVCRYNFSQRCYDTDDIDKNNLAYGYIAGTEFAGFSINTTSGNVTINITTDSGCGSFKVALAVQDPIGEGANANKSFIVNAVNDRPVLSGVPGSSYQNMSFYNDVNANDEETPSGPFHFNVTFVSCYRPFNSEHTNVTNCSGLFAINSSTGLINRSSILKNSEVGNYTINFTVTDPGDNLTGTSIPPYSWLANATGWQTVNFTVLDLNDQPVIEPVANQFWTQNQSAGLVLRASDIDNGTLIFNATTLYRNLSAYVNASLFPISFNQTLYQNNGTSLGNASMNFTPLLNGQVGNYTVNISVYDGHENGTYSILVNLTVTNINDPPNLNFSCRNYAVEGLPYVCNAGQNTTDPDNFPSYVPYNDTVNGTLTFHLNFTSCAKANASDTNCSILDINQTTGMLNYTDPLRKDAGNYTINISVTDGGNLTSWMLFNFTVIADYAPNIITTVPPQNMTQNQPFYLGINATDQDNATDNLTFRTETYYNSTLLNSTKFPAGTDRSMWPPGPAAGVMNYTSVNNSQVGNYTVKIIVNDTLGREDSVMVNFTVYNVNDPPALNFSCVNYTYESTYYSSANYMCNAGENTTDPDQQTPYGENLTYGMAFITGLPLFSINSTTGLINFTAANDTFANNTLNYTYVVNITVADSGGLIDSRTLNITVYAVNDPPVLNFTNTSAYVNSMYFENVGSETADEENDLPLFYNITFVSCSKANISDTNCSIFAINSSTGVINFNALQKDAGNYTINVTATDRGNTTQPYNATGWRLVNLRVRSPNSLPTADIAGVIPSSTFYENDTVMFLINVTDADGDPLYCKWYRNSTEIGSMDSCQNSNSWSYTPSFEESGNWTIRLEATDTMNTSYDDWHVVILNKNRPPELAYPLQNQSWNMNTENRNIVLSYNFRDPDNENGVTNDDNNLTVNWTVPTYVDVLVDSQVSPVTIPGINWTGKASVTLAPQTDWYGIDYITFFVNDSEFAATSNNVTLNVSYTETQTQTVMQQGGGGGAGGGVAGTKIASLTITVSPFERIVSYNKTSATVTLKNTGEVPLSGINVDAYVKESDEITLGLSQKYVSQLGVGESAATTLTMTTYQLTKESYEIKITGSVKDPKFNQSTTIYIKPIFNETRLEEKLKFVKDLFQDNPECIDLMELIIQAEKEVRGNNIAKAEELTEAALDNCRDIIRYSNATKYKVTPETEQIPLNEIIIALLAITLFAIVAYLLIERRATSKKVKKT